MTVIEEVLSDPELSVPVTLWHVDDTATRTRGVFRRLAQSAAQLMGSFSKSGPNVWVSTPANESPVQNVTVNGGTFRVLDSEQVGNAGASWIGTSTRYQLIDP